MYGEKINMDNKTDQDHEIIEKLKTDLKKEKALKDFFYKSFNYYYKWNRDGNRLIKFLDEQLYSMYNHQKCNFKSDDPLYNHSFKVGEIFLFRFGLNIMPEMSFSHMGIVIAKNGSYLYVLPIMSYKESYSNAYHPVTNNKNYDRNYYLMKSDEFDFLDHDSILKLTDLRTVSKKRAIKFTGHRININSEFFKTITYMANQVHFPDVLYRIEDENRKLKAEIVRLRELRHNTKTLNLEEKEEPIK